MLQNCIEKSPQICGSNKSADPKYSKTEDKSAVLGHFGYSCDPKSRQSQSWSLIQRQHSIYIPTVSVAVLPFYVAAAQILFFHTQFGIQQTLSVWTILVLGLLFHVVVDKNFEKKIK